MATPRHYPAQQVTTQLILPDANGYTWLWDSTDPNPLNKAALGKTAAVRTVGPDRGGAINLTAKVGLSCTGHDVTLVFYTLDGAGAWQLHTSTPITAASVPQYVKWEILSPDALIGVLAGASTPHALASTLTLTETP